MLQVRNLPDEVHAKLKARAAEERMSLSDYVGGELAKLVEYRSNREIIEEFRSKHPDFLKGAPPAAEIIREVREERDAVLAERMDYISARRQAEPSSSE